MPLLRKASDGAGAPPAKPRSPSKAAAAGGRAAGAKGGGADARKTPTPLPPAPAAAGAAAVDDYSAPVREVLRPPNQLPLGEAELAEEVGRSLTAGNPSAPANIVRYSARERGYRADPIIDQQLQHLSLGGCLVHRDSDDAARERQRRDSGALAAHSRRATAQSRRATMRPSEAGGLRAEASTGPAPLMPIPSSLGGAAGLSGEDSTRLRNQFNFADRAAQTGHAAPRERGSQTEPPPTATASGSCSRSEMFEAYIQDQDRQRQMEELARQKAAAAHREARAQQAAARQGSQQPGAGGAAAVLPGLDQDDGSGSLQGLSGQAAKLMERMVHQNLHREVVMDFKYWEDPADAVKQDEGTLLPLWSFANPRAKQLAVTALAWSPRYFDLFAVGYGSFDFLRPTAGLVACYSLKNPGHPEYSFATAAGVMCLDFHPDHPNLLAVGCYDGHICIFDVRAEGGEPLYKSSARAGKHSDPVWQVCWQRSDSHELQLCSISTDGRVTMWSVSKNELSHQDVLELRSLRGREQAAGGAPGPRPATGSSAAGGGQGSEAEEDGQAAGGIAGGCCFDFNREQEYLFIVGAEDGSLYKCSTAYASEYLQAYRPAHHLPVYAVRWNALHSSAFLSAGADWRVKLWDSLQPKPVLSFDLGAPVGDVAWAPFSATVFAAATDAGRVHMFDLAHNSAAPTCVQAVARKSRLTKLAFNARHPVLLVGTEHGGVSCFKLSPNLRRGYTPGAADGGLSRTDSQRAAARAAEAARLDGVLAQAAKCNAAMRDDDFVLM